MKFYGRRFLDRQLESKLAQKSETRDALLYDVDSSARTCRVKIQGSNELITAYYPENWEQTPLWLKPGNSVRIAHREGIRGRIEVVGHGKTLPTGGGITYPSIPVGEDGVMTGCRVIQCPNNPRLAVLTTIGTVRINGVTYTVPPIDFREDTKWLIGDGGGFGEISGCFETTAPVLADSYRYDIVSVGADLVIDYTEGTAVVGSEPTVPSLAADHVMFRNCPILIHYGATEITNDMLNRSWQARLPVRLEFVLEDQDIAWNDTAWKDVTVKLYDQYNNLIGGNYYLTLEFLYGNGTLRNEDGETSTTQVSGWTNQNSPTSQHVFEYQRDNNDPGDHSPTLKATLIADYEVTMAEYIILRDSANEIMT